MPSNPWCNACTYGIIADLEFLKRNPRFLRHSSQQECRLSIGGVTLVGVGLDHDATIDFGSKIGFVARFVIGVNLPGQ